MCMSGPLGGCAEGDRQAGREWYGWEGGIIARSLSVRWYGHGDGGWVESR
jgi:hypothetical protein